VVIYMVSLANVISLANVHNLHLFVPTVAAFVLPGTNEKPTVISAVQLEIPQAIRQYTRKRGIKSTFPVNPRRRNHPERGR